MRRLKRSDFLHLRERFSQDVARGLDGCGMRLTCFLASFHARGLNDPFPLVVTQITHTRLHQLLFQTLAGACEPLLDSTSPLLVLPFRFLDFLLDLLLNGVSSELDVVLALHQLVVVPLQHLRPNTCCAFGRIVYVILTRQFHFSVPFPTPPPFCPPSQNTPIGSPKLDFHPIATSNSFSHCSRDGA